MISALLTSRRPECNPIFKNNSFDTDINDFNPKNDAWCMETSIDITIKCCFAPHTPLEDLPSTRAAHATLLSLNDKSSDIRE